MPTRRCKIERSNDLWLQYARALMKKVSANKISKVYLSIYYFIKPKTCSLSIAVLFISASTAYCFREKGAIWLVFKLRRCGMKFILENTSYTIVEWRISPFRVRQQWNKYHQWIEGNETKKMIPISQNRKKSTYTVVELRRRNGKRFHINKCHS